MAKELLINVSEGEECRIALVEDAKLEELYMERSSSTSHVNNIYKGRVTNVEASIQAAFIDFGLGRNGFLHISDLMPTYFGRRGEDVTESVGRKMSRRDRPPIQRCLRRGDEIVVQVIKEGIGTKGPTLSSYLSISGKILVMMPGMSGKGVSRKIEDEEERRRLRTILDALQPPPEVGFIIRTAGVGKTKAEIQRDFTYLTRLWSTIEKKRDGGPGPMELYTEGDLVTRTVRDVFTSDIERIIIDNKEVAKRVKEVIKLSSPRTRNKVDLYEEPIPLFHKYNIEHDIELMYSRHVPLPSGGSLVIDSTEAVVAIDVNSGKFRDHSDAETTAFKTDMEAADEIPRQLRLRDLGGVIICDFIDLRYERHRRELEHKLHENFKKDRAKSKVLRMSQFGIIEMTRQRMRPSLKRSIYYDCPHCKGSGLVKTSESMSLDVMRRLAIAVYDQRVLRIELTVSPQVEFYLQNRKRTQIADLERAAGKNILIRGEAKMGLDEIRLDLFDSRDSLVYLPQLAIGEENGQAPAPRPPRHGGRRDQRGHRHGDRRDQQGGRPQQRPANVPPGEEESIADRFDLEGAEDAVDHRQFEEERDQEGADEHADQPAEHRDDQRPSEHGGEGAGDRGGSQPQRQQQHQPAGGQGAWKGDGGNQQPRQDENGEGGRKRRRRRGGRGRRRRQWGDNQEQYNQGVDQGAPVLGGRAYAPQGQGGEGETDSDSDSGASPDAEWQSESADRDASMEPRGDEEFAESEAKHFSTASKAGEAEDFEEVEAAETATDEVAADEIETGEVETGAVESTTAESSEALASPRRGRRRGGRGRGRRGGKRNRAAEGEPVGEQAVGEQSASADESAESVEDAGAVEADEQKAPSRRRRGRRRVSRIPSGGAAAAQKPAGPASGKGADSSQQSGQASQAAAGPIRLPRSASADRHHLNDEPVVHEPPRRVRSYRDLDAIPDDED